MSVASEPGPVGPAREKTQSPFLRFAAEFAESPLAVLGLVVFLTIAVAAVLAPWITPQNPYDLAQLDIMDGRLAPGAESGDGRLIFLLGTDDQGRDMLSAIVYGLRTSIAVGMTSAIAAVALGVVVGLCAAYFGGAFDSIAMRIVDIQLSFPAILIALILIAVLGKGVDKVIIALITVQWAYYARTVRGSALSEMGREYIEAARCLAIPGWRILLKHLLPNCLPPLIVVATVQVANAVALEATLSFLGLGLPITEPSLGLLISNGFQYMLSGRYWISFFPGLALLVTIVSINLVGDHLRDVLNPRLKR